MKLDSTAQKEMLVRLLGQVPVQTTLAELAQGPVGELKELLKAVGDAEIEEEKKEEKEE